MTNTTHMFKLAKAMLPNAYAPYSNFNVACCIKTVNGNYYTGCNVENASYSLAACAETNAILQMVAAGEQMIDEVVIIAKTNVICTPCGACRQRIREFSKADALIHMGTHEGLQQTQTLNELLPFSFGPENLRGNNP